MFAARYITEEDRRRIKENKQKKKEVNNYQYEAVQRMKHILVNNFKNLLGILQENQDQDEKEKYKNAIVGMISKINQSL